MGRYDSFVVRIWSSAPERMHGRIEHVSSRESLVFHDLADIIAFIQRYVTKREAPEVPVAQANEISDEQDVSKGNGE